MASKRPPGTYSPSARTGRRGGWSGSVAGMVRRAGSDALLMSLRSTVPVGSSAASIRRGNRPNTAFGFRGCFDMRNTLQHNPGPRGTRISPAGYFAAFFLRAAQEAFIRSDTASFSLAVIGRLPRRCGVGRGLRYRGGDSRRPLRGGAPSRGLRRGRGPKDLVDVVQRLDLRLQALDFTLPVGDCLCYDTHELPRGCILRRSTRSGLGRARSNGFGF